MLLCDKCCAETQEPHVEYEIYLCESCKKEKKTLHVVVNKFAERHVPRSSFSHYMGKFEEVAGIAKEHFHKGKQGYRDGVWIVPVPVKWFYSGIVELKEGDMLLGQYKKRREGEEPRKTYESPERQKLPAKSVELILYSSKVLAEGGDNDLPPLKGNYEVISINASPVEGEQPIEPMVLLYNHFGMSGGTATNMTAKELETQLAISVPFWANKINASA